jgi:hypothetical protein
MRRDETNQKLLRRGRGLKLIAITSVMVVLIAVPLAVILYPTLKSYPEARFATAASQSERNFQDLAHLRRLPEVDRSFTDETRAAFEQAVASIEQQAGNLDRAGLAMMVARAVALADNGHTNVLGMAGDYGFNAVPVRLSRFADALFIIAATDERRDLLGAKVLGVNGRPTEALVEALGQYTGGTANLAREFAPNLLISPELLAAAGLAETASDSTYDLLFPDGRFGSVELIAETPTQEPASSSLWPKRHLSPAAKDALPTGWRHVLDDLALPPYLARPSANYWHDYPAPDLLYVQINAVKDQGSVSISQYLSDMLDEAGRKPARNAIVDLRFNSGGNYVLTNDFTRRLPEILPPGGRTYILTSANTFPAAIVTAARVKYFSGGNAILIGEPMGDRPQHWGEGGVTVLPNANIAIGYSTAYHDWGNGCSLSQITTCFLLNYVYGVPAGNLQPDVLIAPTFADYVAGKDTTMIEVMRLIAKDEVDG